MKAALSLLLWAACLLVACGHQPKAPLSAKPMEAEFIGTISTNSTNVSGSDNIYVVRYRVPGGWVYLSYKGDSQGGTAETFVPDPSK